MQLVLIISKSNAINCTQKSLNSAIRTKIQLNNFMLMTLVVLEMVLPLQKR